MQYRLYKGLYRVLALCPWWLIDTSAYIVAGVLYGLVRYRRRVVESNLTSCFPDKSPGEIQRITWGFYRHLVYQFLSSPKILMSPPEIIKRKHLQLYNLDQVARDMAERGQKVGIIMLGHVGSWEIFSAGNLFFEMEGLRLEQLYRPLSNAPLDATQRELRMRHRAVTTPKGQVARRIVRLLNNSDEPPTLIAFIADQTPASWHSGLWETFLGRATLFVDGAERLARKYNLPVYYCDIKRISPRHYEGEVSVLCRDSASVPEGDITRLYIRALEATILRDPAIWLWSHKRWKHTPPSSHDS